MKMPTVFRRTAQRTTPRIESDTPIVPRAVMEAVCEEAGVWLGEPLPRRWVRELTARANTVYAHNPRFRRNVRAQGDKGRDYLWAFVRHWLAGLLWERRRHFHARLPASYNCGLPLPSKVRRAPPAQNDSQESAANQVASASGTGLRLRRRRALPFSVTCATAPDAQIDRLVYDLRPDRRRNQNRGRNIMKMPTAFLQLIMRKLQR